MTVMTADALATCTNLYRTVVWSNPVPILCDCQHVALVCRRHAGGFSHQIPCNAATHAATHATSRP